MKKLFASDFDGTFYKLSGVSKKTLLALEQFRKNHIFAIVTGRAPLSVQEKMQTIPFDCDYIIGYNGGVLMDQQGKILYEHDFEIDLSALIQEIKDEKVEKLLVVGKNQLYTHTFKRSLKTYLKDRIYKKSYLKEGYQITKKPIEGPIYMISIECSDNASAKRIASLISADQSVLVNTNYIDIVCKGIGKAKGVAYLANLIQADEIYVIGDSYNDVDMIEQYQGFSVHSADPEIKQKASMCFEDVGEALTYVMEKEEESC